MKTTGSVQTTHNRQNTCQWATFSGGYYSRGPD